MLTTIMATGITHLVLDSLTRGVRWVGLVRESRQASYSWMLSLMITGWSEGTTSPKSSREDRPRIMLPEIWSFTQVKLTRRAKLCGIRSLPLRREEELFCRNSISKNCDTTPYKILLKSCLICTQQINTRLAKKS